MSKNSDRKRPVQRTKFSAMPEMDFSSKIRMIVDRVSCMRHGKSVGKPCWWIPRDSGGFYAGICSARVSNIYNGDVSEVSLSNKRPKKEHAA